MERADKPQVVADLKKGFEEASLVIITQQAGVTVAADYKLRGSLRAIGATHVIAKNTLARLAAKDTPCADIIPFLSGPTCITTTAGDPVAMAKALSDFANSNQKLSIVGGCFNGKVLSAAQVKALASLPSLDQLRSQLIGLIQAPAGNIARVVQAPAAQIARVVGAYSRKE
jgi:large subunit ribosomal protein L10